MSKVYVVQNQQMRDRVTGEMRPRFDLSPARDYGELEFLLESSDLPFRPRPVIEKLRRKLAYYTPDDYLLLIGNPCLIGWTVALAAQVASGRVKLLQWHTQSQSYLLVEANVFDNT